MIKLLNRLLKENFDINFGRHHNRVGYYATMCKTHDYCTSPSQDGWDSAGHGFTLEEALVEAEAIAKGQQSQTKHNPDVFGVTMIIRKETEGVYVQTYEINGDETDLVGEDFEPNGDTVWLDEKDSEIEPPANL